MARKKRSRGPIGVDTSPPRVLMTAGLVAVFAALLALVLTARDWSPALRDSPRAVTSIDSPAAQAAASCYGIDGSTALALLEAGGGALSVGAGPAGPHCALAGPSGAIRAVIEVWDDQAAQALGRDTIEGLFVALRAEATAAAGAPRQLPGPGAQAWIYGFGPTRPTAGEALLLGVDRLARIRFINAEAAQAEQFVQGFGAQLLSRPPAPPG